MNPTLHLRRCRRPVWLGPCLLAATIGFGDAHAQSAPAAHHGGDAEIKRLKAAYLACDALMSARRVDADLAQRCSAVGEQLMQRAFSGDFEALIAWWRRERAAAQVASSKEAP